MSLKEIDEAIAMKKFEIATAQGSQCEVYARIVGYYRAVRNWNVGKREEYNEREEFVV